MIYLALCKTVEESGWGVATRYLGSELSKLTKVIDLRHEPHRIRSNGSVDGKILHAIAGIEFVPNIMACGTMNAGYCFFESDLLDASIKHASFYDHIFCGSTFNVDRLADKGITNTSLLVQGVDQNIFHPSPKQKDPVWRDKFVIFSGGKFEYRKGQDLVMAAFSILQHKYKDLHLVTTWQNVWDFSMDTMRLSPYIDYTVHGRTWEDKMCVLSARNRLFPNRCHHFPLVDHKTLYSLIRNSDIGLFPNRCEGGTNLALMEYMACGKPAIASYNTGHMDILDDLNSIPIMEMEPIECSLNDVETAHWYDPSLEEILSKIEWAYEHRDELKSIGDVAHKSMKQWTWERAAKTVCEVML